MHKYILSLSILAGLMISSYSYAIDVSSCTDLANINNDLTEDYILTQDLDCSGSGNSIMIGSAFPIFEGTFDGSGHTITVNINTSEGIVGLFRRTNQATISNLHVDGSIISTYTAGSSQVGGIVGFAEYTTISNVHVTATITGYNQNIGGIAGYMFESLITGSSTDVTIFGSGDSSYNVGGLVGYLAFSDVSHSFAVGEVSGFSQIGGLVGLTSFSNTYYSYADIDVSANNTAGGLTSILTQGTITDSYALGNVTINANRVGGLIGAIGGSTLARTYAKGVVTGDSYAGGLVGSDDGVNTFSSSFWDIEASAMLTDDIGATGLSTFSMQDISTFTGAGWDFDTIWGISGALNNGYPYLLAIPPLPDDTVAPDTFITFAGGDTVDSPNATFEFLANEDSTFECSIDDGVTIEDFDPCVSPYTRTGLIQGEYIFYVRAVDLANNVDATPAAITWTIADSEEIVSVTPADGETNVTTDATIVVTFAQPVLLDITIASGPCDGSGSMCPVLDGVWSSGNTILTYTRTDEDFHNDTTYSIQITENNGIHWHQIYSGAFTIVAASQGGGGGGGGSANPSRDYCPGEDTSPSFYDRSCGDVVETWKKFFASVSSGGVSKVTDPITVKSFVTDVFTLLGITKPIQRKEDSDTQTVPEKLIMKVMQVLQRILNK